MSKMKTVPIDLEAANEFVLRYHRHHGKVVGHKFSIGATKDGVLCGVAIIGRPIARHRDDGWTLEVTRLCTDGTRNACSYLYGASARAAFALGYTKVGTYIHQDEGGASLRASGWRLIGEAAKPNWNRADRPKKDKSDLTPRFLFETTSTD